MPRLTKPQQDSLKFRARQAEPATADELNALWEKRTRLVRELDEVEQRIADLTPRSPLPDDIDWTYRPK